VPGGLGASTYPNGFATNEIRTALRSFYWCFFCLSLSWTDASDCHLSFSFSAFSSITFVPFSSVLLSVLQYWIYHEESDPAENLGFRPVKAESKRGRSKGVNLKREKKRRKGVNLMKLSRGSPVLISASLKLCPKKGFWSGEEGGISACIYPLRVHGGERQGEKDARSLI